MWPMGRRAGGSDKNLMYRKMALIFAFMAISTVTSAPAALPVTFDAKTPLRANVPSNYLGVNIDAASVAEGMDFANPSLRNLMKALAPIQLRIGGTSSHGLTFTGLPSPPACAKAVCESSCCGNATHHGETFLSTDCVDSIGDFLLATKAELLLGRLGTPREVQRKTSG